MATRIRKGNPAVAAVDGARRGGLEHSGVDSSTWRKVSKYWSDKSSQSNPNTDSYRASVKNASHARLQARFQDKPSVPTKGKPAPSPTDRRFTVTRDNRPEAKGNYSGVDVNNRMVRKGKVKAAERMVGRSLATAAAKRATPYISAAVTGAEVGYAAGKALRAITDKREDKRISKMLTATAKKMGK